jgi:hypothetical protein
VARELLRSMEHVQRAHRSHRDQLREQLARFDGVDGSPVPSLVNAATDAERGRDTHIEVQERT